MRKKTHSRWLATLLAVAMCLSMLPAGVLAAEETAVWEQIELSEIKSDDTIAITMTKGSDVWLLPNIGEGPKKQPLAISASVFDSLLSTDNIDKYAWNIIETDGGYHIKSINGYLCYTTKDNTGVRVGTTQSVWTLDNGYLSVLDTQSAQRWIGIYNGTDWRGYTNTTGNTAGQSVSFWKLAEGETPPIPVKVATPSCAPASGSTVEPDSTVALFCATEGVNYRKGGSKDTLVNFEGSTFTLPEEDGEYTIFVQAMKAGLEDSDIAEFKFTVKAKLPAQEVTIAEARGGTKGTEYTVTGVVTLKDGLNLYIQDETAGICTRVSNASAFEVGDTIKATGSWDEYNSLTQLSPATAEKIGDGILPEPLALTINDIAESYEAQRIIISGAKVTNINGTTVTLSQGEGDAAATTTIYKCPAKETLTVGDTVTVTAVVSQFKTNYQLLVATSEDIDITDDTDPVDPPDLNLAVLPETGDYVIWVGSTYNQALSSNMNSNGYVLGQAVTANENGTLSGPTATEVWTVTRMDTTDSKTSGIYTIQQNDKFLGINEKGYLTVATAPVNQEWTIEVNETYTYMKSNGNNKYLEWYAQYSDWSLYGTSQPTSDLYQLTFTPKAKVDIPETSIYETDPDVEEAIAAWGGGNQLEDSVRAVNGDLFQVGDMLDDNAVYTAVVNGEAVVPFTTGTSTATGSTSWYMGGKGVGSGIEDYLQFAMPTTGWGDMTLSFRLRVSGSGVGSWQLQYSTDGADFSNFTSGSYSYGYTIWGKNEEGNSAIVESGTRTGTITDGIAKTSMNSGAYIEFTFDVPAGAEDVDTLYIRLAPGTTRADGKEGTPGTGSTVRIDSVVLSGHPILSDAITGYVAVDPDGREEDQPAGTALTMTSATEGAAIYYRFNFNGEGGYRVYDKADKPVLPEPLPANLEVYAAAPGKAQSVKRVFTYAAGTVEAVRMTPNGGGIIFGDEEAKTVTLTCGTADATIYYAVDSDEFREYDPEQPIVLTKGFGTATVKAYATRDGFTDSAVVTRTFTERATDRYQLFFGQLHSHTSYSDGAGTAAEAFQHAYDNREAYNIDFLAVTDHSNSFDNADTCDITDGSKSTEWVEGKGLAREATTDDFVGLFGYEMTWSNGLGHMNTFNTSGFQSRTQADYSTYNTALQNYYAALKRVGGSISQFNHPGNTFGDFSDFAHYDEEIDQLITMIEVGNGEGAIGSSGYFPSYEYYTRALDKGWHVAPTNNQDNHKGGWGTANTGRDVVLVDELTEEAIYDAMRNYRMYATEDLNLSIYYTFDGQIMGTILDRESYPAGTKAAIRVELSDADTVAGLGDAGEATVQVIVNGGKVLEEKKAACATTVEFSVPADYSYYYIKVTQADGDIAVTAPVWVGKVEAVGITALSAASDLTVTGQEQRFTLELYNNEKKPLEVTSIVFTDDKGNVLHTATDVTSVPKLGTASTTFAHTFDADGMVTITATVKGTLDGVEKVYTQNLELSVMPKAIVKRVIVDGTHYNDYVTGYYGGNINNASTIAASLGVEVVVEQEAITAEMLEDCELLVISAPARKSGTANAGAFVPAAYEDSFISMVADYVQRGGRVVVCGLADYQDDKTAGTVYQTSVQQNRLLEAIGSTMRINDDEAYDEEKNGGQAYRLYPETFNIDSPWTKGIVEGQTYSQYSGCTVDLGQGTWLVRGFDSTYSIDSDNDGKGGVAKGEAIFLAAEDVGQGTVFAAGGVFLSDFEVKAELDNIWDLPYANRTIFENMLSAVRTEVAVTPIAETRKAELNKIFVVEGYVTNGTTDPNTTFFDAIYIQDETGGTTAFPYSAAGLAEGTKVRILGYTDAYQDDREIQIITLEVLDAPAQKQAPKVLTTAQAMDYETYGGQLLSTSGVVSEIVQANGVVSQFKLTDSSGKAATIFIDGYITNAKGENTIASWLRAGQTVSAVGLLYKHPEGSSDVSVPVFRVRNCDEIQLISQPSGGSGGGSSRPNRPTRPVIEVLGEENIPLAGALPFVDVAAEDWFYTAVYALYETGMMDGVDETHFAPHVPLTRGMAVTILHRLENSPAVEGGISFPDVAPGQYYTDGVIWAAANGVVVGCDDGNYRPDAPVTREQMALILCRYAQFKGYEWTAPAALDAFEDAGAVSGYAVEAMGWAVANGLMEGVGGSRLAPAATATRAEIAALLTRFLSQAYIPETAEK